MFHIVTPVKGKPFTIGRKEDCDIRFSDVFVSREHAVLENIQGEWLLKNLSTNSVTQLNGKDVNESPLKDGDIVVVGLHQIRVTLRGEDLSLLLLDSFDSAETFAISEEAKEIELSSGDSKKITLKAHAKDDHCTLAFKEKISDCNGKKVSRIILSEGETARLENFEFSYKSGELLSRNILSGFDVQVRNLDVYAGKKKLLNNINFNLPAGEILAVIGRSGQGKSSLLKLLKGEYGKAETSSVLFAGVDYRKKEIRRRVAFLPQEPALRNDLTVRETLFHGAKTSMEPRELKATFQEKSDRICELFGLSHRKDNFVQTLSGGEMRRVGLAQELMGSPGLIVLDEPLSGLDPYNSNILCSHLKQLSFLGHTVILTTHSYEALNIANKVLVLHQGEQCFYGTREEAYHFFKTKDAETILSGLNDESAVRWNNSQNKPFKEQSAVESKTYFFPSKLPSLFFYHLQLIFKQWFRDRGKVAALLIQPIVIGFLFSQIFSKNSSIWSISFALILCANWFALSLSIREIVQEKEILNADLRKGVGIFPYLLVKSLVPSLVAFLQTLVVFVFVAIKAAIHPSPALLSLIVLTTVLPAVSMGLLVSSFSRNPGQANAFLPLVIIPQVALAGALVPLDQMTAVGKALSYAVWSRYNQGSLLDLLLERPLGAIDIVLAVTLALIFFIIASLNLFHLRKAK